MSRIALCLIALGALAACQAPPSVSVPVAAAGPPTKEYRVRETRLLNGLVSVRLEIPPAPAGPQPTVIALLGDTHGLLDAGFIAVTYTVYWDLLRTPVPTPPPGQSVGTWVLASPSADVLGQPYVRDIARNATEVVPAIVDWLTTQPEVDAKRLGMIGGSTNGFVTLQALAAEPRLGAAVAIAACGDYECFLRDSSMGMQGAPLALTPDYAAWLREQDVTRTPQRLTHGALLMLNRTGDVLIPFACAEQTAAVLTQAYAKAGATERFRFTSFDIEGHGIGPQETQAAMQWLQRWLAAPVP
ncbi:MAG: prolyl oligopeptidase family serine peptidase [bacterium]